MIAELQNWVEKKEREFCEGEFGKKQKDWTKEEWNRYYDGLEMRYDHYGDLGGHSLQAPHRRFVSDSERLGV